MDNAQERVEALGPAERIINAITQHVDHMVHNRPGLVVNDARHNVGVRQGGQDETDWRGPHTDNTFTGVVDL